MMDIDLALAAPLRPEREDREEPGDQGDHAKGPAKVHGPLVPHPAAPLTGSAYTDPAVWNPEGDADELRAAARRIRRLEL